MTPEYPPRNPFPCAPYPSLHERELEWERLAYERWREDARAGLLEMEKKAGAKTKEENTSMKDPHDTREELSQRIQQVRVTRAKWLAELFILENGDTVVSHDAFLLRVFAKWLDEVLDKQMV